MHPDPSQTPASPTPPRSGCLWIALLLLVLSCAGAGTALYITYRKAMSAAAPPPVTVVRPTPSVVTSMRELSILQTSTFHIERVVDLRNRQSALFGLVNSEDAILLVAAGDVVAGVDLGQLRDEDVQVDHTARTVKLRLPAAVVLSSALDNDATYVHTRQTDLLAKRVDQLETKARREAERTLREAALSAGILARAQEGAERTVRSLIHSLGYQVTQVTFRSE